MMYVVTGGGGFIGSNIVAEIERRRLGDIIVIDDMGSQRKWRNLAKRSSIMAIVPPGAVAQALASVPKNEAAVIHMGARTSTRDTDAAALISENTMLTAKLFETAAKNRWPFVFASSAQVYGVSKDQSEETTPTPVTPYGWSKALADQIVMRMDKGGLAPPVWASLRFFNVYGAAEDHKGDDKSFVTRCFDAIRTKKPIILFRGSDGFVRDWVSVADCARLTVDIATGAKPIRGIFNVGTGVPVSFAEVAATCIEVSGLPQHASTIPFPEDMIGCYQSYTRAETKKLLAAFPGFQFESLKAGAARYWKEHARRDGMDRFP